MPLSLSIACGTAATPTDAPTRQEPDAFGVRYSGGETTDFGNGSDDFCGYWYHATVVSDEAAAELGFDVAQDREELRQEHSAALRYNPGECEATGELCDETQVAVTAEVTQAMVREITESRDEVECPTGILSMVYEAAVHIVTEDGSLDGIYYTMLYAATDDQGTTHLAGRVATDIRNFEGSLPLNFDIGTTHYAYADVSVSLGTDGSVYGSFTPMVQYFEESADGGLPSATRIGPDAVWGGHADEVNFDASSVLAEEGTRTNLTDYLGSATEPELNLKVRVDAVEPAVDVDVTVRVDGDVFEQGTVAPGTYIDLGPQPFGTVVLVEAHNTNGAGMIRAHVLQGDYFVASDSCESDDCSVSVEYSVGWTPNLYGT